MRRCRASERGRLLAASAPGASVLALVLRRSTSVNTANTSNTVMLQLLLLRPMRLRAMVVLLQRY